LKAASECNSSDLVKKSSTQLETLVDGTAFGGHEANVEGWTST
jgi:hypothetical protein